MSTLVLRCVPPWSDCGVDQGNPDCWRQL